VTASEHRAKAEELAEASAANLDLFAKLSEGPRGGSPVLVAVAQAQAALAQVHATLAGAAL
jgi:hypothetical protein